MQSIADISIFKTPFESSESFGVKFARIQTMFEDYLINAWMEVIVKSSENDNYITRNYHDPDDRIISISFSFQKNLSDISYFPAGIINYNLNPFVLEKENIEHFLNDNISFIWNVFATEFFIDVNSNYRLDERSTGKKLDYANLRAFDMENPKSEENKQLLDSLMYIYFGLMKNIFNLENNTDILDQFLKNTRLSDIGATFELFAKRGDVTKDALVAQARLVKGQIDTFITLVS